jgi:hypothetical protein
MEGGGRRYLSNGITALDPPRGGPDKKSQRQAETYFSAIDDLVMSMTAKSWPIRAGLGSGLHRVEGGRVYTPLAPRGINPVQEGQSGAIGLQT